MDDGSRLYLGILLGIIFLIVKGIFTAAESAVTEINDSKLKKLAESDEDAKKLFKIMEKPNKLLISLSIFKTLTAVIVTIIAVLTFFTSVSDFFKKNNVQDNFAALFSIVIIILVVTLILAVFGENIPKWMAMKNGDKFALKISGLLKAMIILLTPLTVCISGITFAFGKLLGFSANSRKEAVTEEEILLMVDAVNETGAIEESQREMINNIFEFDEIQISDVMTHRIDIAAVEKNATVKDVVELSASEGVSRIPVYENTIDNILGVINVKDLLPLIGTENPGENPLDEFLRDILYIPETNFCQDLLKEFTQTKAQIAVAIDEYGGTAGIVTMEDILEAIVGNIQDEYDDEAEEIIEISDGVYEVSGAADPDMVLDLFGISLPDEHDYDTIGGFIVDVLGHFPGENEFPEITYEKAKFIVLSAEEKRIVKLKAIFAEKEQKTD